MTRTNHKTVFKRKLDLSPGVELLGCFYELCLPLSHHHVRHRAAELAGSDPAPSGQDSGEFVFLVGGESATEVNLCLQIHALGHAHIISVHDL